MSQRTVGQRIIHYRQSISPRTSYATGGKATDEIIFEFNESEVNILQNLMNEISLVLKESKEFEIMTNYNKQNIDKSNIVNGHVIVSFNPISDILTQLINLIVENKTILIFLIFTQHDINENEIKQQIQSKSHNNCIITIENINHIKLFILTKSSNQLIKNINNLQMIGNWQHPTVVSRKQFQYLWLEKTSSGGKRRILQRLANHTIKRDNKQYKLKSDYFDTIIFNAIKQNKDDYEIYSILRLIYLNSILPDISESQRLDYPKLTDKELTPTEPWGDDDGDGRSNFMVKKLKECIPTRKFTDGSIKMILDYGCAEGAITANLCKELQLQPHQCYGADVRKIPAEGFTFILLPNETDMSPTIGTILPSIPNTSIDLITASMVFHHVKHVKAAILELRRIIAKDGILIIREHDCHSAGVQ